MSSDAVLRSITLARLPRPVRTVALWFIVTLTVGYTTGLVFVAHTTSMTPAGVRDRYRGNQNEGQDDGGVAGPTSRSGPAPMEVPAAVDTGAVAATGAAVDTGAVVPQFDTNAAISTSTAEQPEMKFRKSLPEMLNITHTHILAMASFLLPVALLFAFSSRVRGRWKTFLLVEPFVALLVSFGAMWAMWGVHPAFSYLLMLSSGSFAFCLYAMLLLSFVELWRARKVDD